MLFICQIYARILYILGFLEKKEGSPHKDGLYYYYRFNKKHASELLDKFYPYKLSEYGNKNINSERNEGVDRAKPDTEH